MGDPGEARGAGEGPIVLRYRLSREEYVRAARLRFRRAAAFSHFAGYALGFLALGALVGLFGGPAWLSWGLGWTGIVLLGVLASSYLFTPGYWWKALPASQRGADYVLECDEAGLRLIAPGIDSRLSWDFYEGYMLTPEWYVLTFQGYGFSALPRRGLASEADRERFEALLARKLEAAD